MKDGYIVVYQDVRGRYLSEGEWVQVRPHNPAKNGPGRRRKHRHLRHHRLAGEEHPGQQRQGRDVGHLVPGLLRSAGMIDAHPALKAVSPQAPVTDWYLGDDSFHNGAFLLAHNFSFYVRFLPRPGGPATAAAKTAFDCGTPDGYEFYLRMGPLVKSNRKYLKGANPYWKINRAPQVRRLLAGAVHLAALQEHEAGGAGGRRLVRRRRPAGPAADVSDHRAASPGRRPTPRHGPVDARRMVARRRRQGRPGHASARRPPSIIASRSSSRSSTGTSRDDHQAVAEALMFVTGLNEWRGRDVAAEGRAEEDAVPRRRRLAWLAGADAGDGFDEYVSDPGKPVPLVGYTARTCRPTT